jgi:hypothetical protein
MIHLRSFATNTEYKELSLEILYALKKLYKDSVVRIWDKDDLTVEIVKYADNYEHGYGYFIWKPYLLNKEIKKLSNGDILFYVDGRTGLTKNKKYKLRNKFFKISWVNKFLKDSEKDILVWQMDHNPERSWTTGDVMNIFDVSLDSDYATTGQYSATFFALRVNKNTIDFLNNWYQNMNKYIDFSRDDPSSKLNHKTFEQNRYDQSFFSMTLKLNKSNLRIQNVTNHDIFDNQTLIPHMKRHPK